jgi:hypothetical protein
VDDLEVDPGWPLSLRTLRALVPGAGRILSRRQQVDGLALVRDIWLSFTSTVVLVGIVAVFVTSGAERTSAVLWFAALLLYGVASPIVAKAIVRPLVCTDLSTLAGSFRTRFFVQLAVAESPCLFAFVGTIITGHWWLYWATLPFTLYGFWRGAPTPGHLLAEQEKLRDQGCNLSLVRALRTPTAA